MNFKAQQAYCSYCKHHNATNVENIICGLTNTLPELEEGCEKMDLAQKTERNINNDPLEEMNKKFEKSMPLYLKIILFILFVYFMSGFLNFSSTVIFRIK